MPKKLTLPRTKDPKYPRAVIWQFKEFDGKRFVDARAFFKSGPDGPPVPTKQGVTIRPEELTKVIEWLCPLRRELEEEARG